MKNETPKTIAARRWRENNRAAVLCNKAAQRAKRTSVPYRLRRRDVAEIQRKLDAGVCELTGLRFSSKGGARSHLSASLDRRVPALGYVPGNVRVVCFGINAALGNWGEAALREIIKAWQAREADAYAEAVLGPLGVFA